MSTKRSASAAAFERYVYPAKYRKMQIMNGLRQARAGARQVAAWRGGAPLPRGREALDERKAFVVLLLLFIMLVVFLDSDGVGEDEAEQRMPRADWVRPSSNDINRWVEGWRGQSLLHARAGISMLCAGLTLVNTV